MTQCAGRMHTALPTSPARSHQPQAASSPRTWRCAPRLPGIAQPQLQVGILLAARHQLGCVHVQVVQPHAPAVVWLARCLLLACDVAAVRLLVRKQGAPGLSRIWCCFDAGHKLLPHAAADCVFRVAGNVRIQVRAPGTACAGAAAPLWCLHGHHGRQTLLHVQHRVAMLLAITLRAVAFITGTRRQAAAPSPPTCIMNARQGARVCCKPTAAALCTRVVPPCQRVARPSASQALVSVWCLSSNAGAC